MSPSGAQNFEATPRLFGNFVNLGFRIEVSDENKREKRDNHFAVSVNFRVMNWSERAEIVSLCLQLITCFLRAQNKLCGHYMYCGLNTERVGSQFAGCRKYQV